MTHVYEALLVVSLNHLCIMSFMASF